MQHVFWALANALWQSAAVAILVGLSLRFIPRTTAAQRYALWLAVLVAAALLPIADLAMPSRTIAVPVNAPPPPVVARVVTRVSQVVAPPIDVRRAAAPPIALRTRHMPDLPSALLVLWLAIASALLVRLGLAYASLRGVKASLVPNDALTTRVQGFNGVWSRHAVVGVSPAVAEPCAIGFLHPAIALSTAMVTSLPARDLERVLRHEYAHVRRYDDYANLLQRLLAALLWFNPVVHFAGRAMAIEREIACDDAAATASDERVAFARCLYEIARTAPRRRHAAAAGFVGTRRQISLRVARLVERNHNASTCLGLFAKVTAIMILAVSFALASVRLTALAVSQSAPLAPTLAASPEPPVARILRRVAQVTPPPPPSARPAATARPLPSSSPYSYHYHYDYGGYHYNYRYDSRPRTSAHDGQGLLDALSNAGFKNLSVDDVIILANRGVSPRLVGELHARGLTPMPVDSLARIADSGVTPNYIEGLARLGYANLPVDDYVRLRDAGVTVEMIQRLQRSGLLNHRATVEELIKLANAGV
jgi:beta-lactamase regulating signal transducer with metallopeptidase domain